MKPALPLLLPLLLFACGPVVQIGGSNPPPDALHTLTADAPATVPSGIAPIDQAQSVSVGLPVVPGALQTVRIPVTVSDTAIQYVRGGQWSEQPARLFQRLLADNIAARGIAVIDPRSSGQFGGRQLTGQLQAFGVDTRGATPTAHVRYDATLRAADGIRQRRFEQQVPIASVDGAIAAEALNRAANRIAADIATWLGAPANDRATDG